MKGQQFSSQHLLTLYWSLCLRPFKCISLALGSLKLHSHNLQWKRMTFPSSFRTLVWKKKNTISDQIGSKQNLKWSKNRNIYNFSFFFVFSIYLYHFFSAKNGLKLLISYVPNTGMHHHAGLIFKSVFKLNLHPLLKPGILYTDWFDFELKDPSVSASWLPRPNF